MKVPTPRPDPYGYKIRKEELKARFLRRFADPAYDEFREVLEQMSEVAWEAHQDNHKAPFVSPAGKGFKDPKYQLSDEWRAARDAIKVAEKLHKDPKSKSRVLLISASNRNDRSCPGEVSKSRLMVEIAKRALEKQKVEVEILDLSNMTSEYGKTIHPCKACVSTAMPLCHYPCSCYPNYAADQMQDWMHDIYPMFARAHGVMIVTPVYWYQAPASLKLLMERMVCADGGNPDPTSTHGKKAKEAKELELKGWDYPKHLEGRLFSLVVHGDTAGVDGLRSNLTSWLNDIHMVQASYQSTISRYIDYYGTYAESHDAFDKDKAIQAEVRLTATSLALSIKAQRKGLLTTITPDLEEPRAK